MNEKVLLEARALISGFLQNRRKELGMTQEQLAELSGNGYRDWETQSLS